MLLNITYIKYFSSVTLLRVELYESFEQQLMVKRNAGPSLVLDGTLRTIVGQRVAYPCL